MPLRRRARSRRPGNRPARVFLNIPYDEKFEKLYLGYIAGVSAFGLIARATLQLRASIRMLDRILALLKVCPVLLHDLSPEEVARLPQSPPRFNVPLAL